MHSATHGQWSPQAVDSEPCRLVQSLTSVGLSRTVFGHVIIWGFPEPSHHSEQLKRCMHKLSKSQKSGFEKIAVEVVDMQTAKIQLNSDLAKYILYGSA